ncbi:MAG: isochorismate synthase [Cyanobacteriota bacterium]|nr:isochorismate synthase [Cyanobacteriota bacterium]
MKLELMLRNALQSLFESVGRIFSPTDDAYPEIGVQPFEGEPYGESE